MRKDEGLVMERVPVVAKEGRAGFAETCKVPLENVTVVSRLEYEANTANLEGPNAVAQF